MALYIGGITGGPEHIGAPFRRQMDAITLREEALQPGMIKPGDGLLNVVFAFSGSLFRPDFEGIRIGRFIKKENRLEVRIAVPPEDVTAVDFAKRHVALIKLAIQEAKNVFDKKGIPFSLEDHIALIDKSLEAVKAEAK